MWLSRILTLLQFITFSLNVNISKENPSALFALDCPQRVFVIILPLVVFEGSDMFRCITSFQLYIQPAFNKACKKHTNLLFCISKHVMKYVTICSIIHIFFLLIS